MVAPRNPLDVLRGRQIGPYRGLMAKPTAMPVTTAQAPSRGLGYRPPNAFQGLAGGGLRGLGQMLMQLGAGRPELAGQAFSSGLDQFDATQRQNAADAMSAEAFDWEREDRDIAAAKYAQTQDLIDSLDMPEDQKTLLRTGLADWGDLNPKDTWEIKTIREGDQDVTYRINPKTGAREKLGSGIAFKPGKDGGNSLSIAAPVWGMDSQGNPVLLQMSPSGVAVQTTLPDGVTPVRPNVQVDTGTGTAMVSPITGGATTVIPKDIKGKESAEVQGAAEGQAVVDLPGALAKAEEARAQLKALKNHPGRQYATGKSAVLPIIPGTAAKDFEVLLNQAKGGVFLQAYTQLKGGGAITQIEGEKAEQAIARMERAQTEGEFLAALDEYDSVIAAGMERLKARAGKGGTPYASGGAVPPPPPGFVVQQ